MPALLIWEKWLPTPNGDDIATAMRSDIRDGLWLLARQWQLGEFKAEDAGTAAAAHIIAHTSPLQRQQPPSGQPRALDPNAPLNAIVERMPAAFDLTLRIEAGREWRRLLLGAGKANAWKAFSLNALLHFKVREPTYDPNDGELPFLQHEPYSQLLAAVAGGRMVDGWRLFEQLTQRKASEFLSQPDPVVDDLGKKWLGWVYQLLGVPAERQASQKRDAESCWDASRLEYRFDSAAVDEKGVEQCLTTSEHYGRGMDWFDFELSDGNIELKQDLDRQRVVEHRRTFIPALVSFPGMPRARWWEIEDSTIDIGNIRAAKTDTGVLLLSEFSLLFSNDWLMVPFPLPIGNLAKIRNIRVTDVFGVQSVVNSIYGQGISNTWELFQLNASITGKTADWLFLAPINNRWLQSQPVEQVRFVRDEFANMVWAIEQTVPDGIGGSLEGQKAADDLEGFLRELAESSNTSPQPSPQLQTNDARLKYAVGTTVPPNWIPFLPVRPNPSKPNMVLRRAAMPRLIEGQIPTRIRPRTQILRTPANNENIGNNGNLLGTIYDVQEEEIPVTGVTLRSVWRRARWLDGRTITWLAYEKSFGMQSVGSGLQFDQVIEQ